MSILSVDTIQPIGSGSTVTLNAAKIVVGTGITFESNGQAIYAGIITATSFSGSGANLTSLPAANITGTLPAISGANLTGITTTTINNMSQEVSKRYAQRGVSASKEDVAKPKILGSKIVTRVDNQHAFLINRNRLGSMVLTGESLYLLECQSASYAILACNEAEKAANIKVIDYRMIGPNGRLYLSGDEAEVRNARDAAEKALLKLGAK